MISREALINSHFVIPAKAGIQKNQHPGHRLSPVRRINQRFPSCLLLAALLWLSAPLAAGGEAATANPKGIRMETIFLPHPRTDGDFPVERAMRQRRSVRHYSGAALSLSEIGQLLWSAQGITGTDGRRTAPSAGALYPLELALVAGNVAGLSPGVYRYNPSAHALTPVAAGDRRAQLAQAALDQAWMETAPAVIAFGAAEERTTWKYGRRGIGYIYIEAGHAAQNVFLQAEALGLGAGVVGAFDDSRTAAVLNLPQDTRPLYLMPVGKP